MHQRRSHRSRPALALAALICALRAVDAGATTPTPTPTPTPAPTPTPVTLTSLRIAVGYPETKITTGTTTNLLGNTGGQFLANAVSGVLNVVATSDPSVMGGTIVPGDMSSTTFSCSEPPVLSDFTCSVVESDREGETIPATCSVLLTSGGCPGVFKVSTSYPAATPTPTPIEVTPTPVLPTPSPPTPTPVVTPTPAPSPTPTPTAAPVVTPTPTVAPTPTPTPIDIVFADDFESGNLDKWAKISDKAPPPRMYVSTLAKYAGTRGLLFDATGLPPPSNRAKLWVKDTSPALEKRYRARFLMNLNTLAVPTTPRVLRLLTGRLAGDPAARPFELRLQYAAPNWFIYGIARSNGDVTNFPTAKIQLPKPGWAAIEIDWKQATGPGANDGSFSLKVNGTTQSVSNVPNDQVFIDGIQLGFLGGLGTSSTGTVLMDEFESRRQGEFVTPAPSVAEGQE